MARIISFAHTTPALLAGRKSCTRRAWKDQWAQRFHAGDPIAAWNYSPRVRGARHVANLRLTAEPVKESTLDAPDSDYGAEGFGYLEEQGVTVFGLPVRDLWEQWRTEGEVLWVVRFELLEVL